MATEGHVNDAINLMASLQRTGATVVGDNRSSRSAILGRVPATSTQRSQKAAASRGRPKDIEVIDLTQSDDESKPDAAGDSLARHSLRGRFAIASATSRAMPSSQPGLIATAAFSPPAIGASLADPTSGFDNIQSSPTVRVAANRKAAVETGAARRARATSNRKIPPHKDDGVQRRPCAHPARIVIDLTVEDSASSDSERDVGKENAQCASEQHIFQRAPPTSTPAEVAPPPRPPVVDIRWREIPGLAYLSHVLASTTKSTSWSILPEVGSVILEDEASDSQGQCADDHVSQNEQHTSASLLATCPSPKTNRCAIEDPFAPARSSPQRSSPLMLPLLPTIEHQSSLSPPARHAVVKQEPIGEQSSSEAEEVKDEANAIEATLASTIKDEREADRKKGGSEISPKTTHPGETQPLSAAKTLIKSAIEADACTPDNRQDQIRFLTLLGRYDSDSTNREDEQQCERQLAGGTKFVADQPALEAARQLPRTEGIPSVTPTKLPPRQSPKMTKEMLRMGDRVGDKKAWLFPVIDTKSKKLEGRPDVVAIERERRPRSEIDEPGDFSADLWEDRERQRKRGERDERRRKRRATVSELIHSISEAVGASSPEFCQVPRDNQQHQQPGLGQKKAEAAGAEHGTTCTDGRDKTGVKRHRADGDLDASSPGKRECCADTTKVKASHERSGHVGHSGTPTGEDWTGRARARSQPTTLEDASDESNSSRRQQLVGTPDPEGWMRGSRIRFRHSPPARLDRAAMSDCNHSKSRQRRADTPAPEEWARDCPALAQATSPAECGSDDASDADDFKNRQRRSESPAPEECGRRSRAQTQSAPVGSVGTENDESSDPNGARDETNRVVPTPAPGAITGEVAGDMAGHPPLHPAKDWGVKPQRKRKRREKAARAAKNFKQAKALKARQKKWLRQKRGRQQRQQWQQKQREDLE